MQHESVIVSAVLFDHDHGAGREMGGFIEELCLVRGVSLTRSVGENITSAELLGILAYPGG
jgi:hypothetical protein